MASNLSPLPPLPAPFEPVVDQKTGRVSQSWYQYLKRLDEHLREVEARVTALE